MGVVVGNVVLVVNILVYCPDLVLEIQVLLTAVSHLLELFWMFARGWSHPQVRVDPI
jgi:hypothetical protein